MRLIVSIYSSTPLRQHLRALLITLLCGVMTSCAARPIDSNEISGSFERNLKKLDLDNSFAFIHGRDELYFTRILLTEDGYKCRFFIGFKNGQFKYRFPGYRLAELAMIYDEKISLQSKKDRAMLKIDDFAVEEQKCTAEIAEREKTSGEHLGEVIANLFYAPLAAIGIIGMVTFGAEDNVQSIKDSIL